MINYVTLIKASFYMLPTLCTWLQALHSANLQIPGCNQAHPAPSQLPYLKSTELCSSWDFSQFWDEG